MTLHTFDHRIVRVTAPVDGAGTGCDHCGMDTDPIIAAVTVPIVPLDANDPEAPRTQTIRVGVACIVDAIIEYQTADGTAEIEVHASTPLPRRLTAP